MRTNTKEELQNPKSGMIASFMLEDGSRYDRFVTGVKDVNDNGKIETKVFYMSEVNHGTSMYLDEWRNSLDTIGFHVYDN